MNNKPSPHNEPSPHTQWRLGKYQTCLSTRTKINEFYKVKRSEKSPFYLLPDDLLPKILNLLLEMEYQELQRKIKYVVFYTDDQLLLFRWVIKTYRGDVRTWFEHTGLLSYIIHLGKLDFLIYCVETLAMPICPRYIEIAKNYKHRHIVQFLAGRTHRI